MNEYDFYTVVFGVSRALGCLANGVWARAFGLPIERPNSIGITHIEKLKWFVSDLYQQNFLKSI